MAIERTERYGPDGLIEATEREVPDTTDFYTPVTSLFRADPTRTRKLLLHAEEIKKLIGKVERAGYTLVPLDLHYSKGRIKAQIGLAKGKKLHDKRQDEQEKDWKREQGRLLRSKSKD